MHRQAIFVCLLFLSVRGVMPAMEIATGSMLGPHYDQRAFYYRTPEDPSWRKTYSGKGYKHEARGKLMNLRLEGGLSAGEGVADGLVDPDRNTAALIEALDFYKQHGVLAIDVALQAAGFGDVPMATGFGKGGIEWPGRGGVFLADGSLRRDWLGRLDTLLREADRLEMVVCLVYFYPGQDQLFRSPEAIEAGAQHMTDWLIDRRFRNVIIDVASEWDLKGERWGQGGYIPSNIAGLVERIRERFEAKHADYTLPIGAATSSSMLYPASLAETCDMVLLHGNGKNAEEKLARLRQYKDIQRPVLMTGDDNGREMSQDNFDQDRASCDAFFREGAGWGYTGWEPPGLSFFRYKPGRNAEFATQAPGPQREQAYFHAVLDSIARLVMEKMPEAPAAGQRRGAS